MMNGDQAEITRGLEEATQKNEKEIVIDFTADRISHYIGVYLLAFLAVVAKISELAGTNLSCYPFGNSTVRTDFIKYATAYCWEVSELLAPGEKEHGLSACAFNSTVFGRRFLQNPSFFKGLIQWLPYVMILEAILFAIPSLFWHYWIGARLMGHLKFMKQLLGEIYEKVKLNKTAIYNKGEAYDRESYYLDGGKGFKPKYWESHDRDSPPGSLRKRHGFFRNFSSCLQSEEKNGQLDEDASEAGSQQLRQNKDENTVEDSSHDSKFVSFFVGGMRDRHVFSMFCFENFSSLEHIPYILSVYNLSKAAEEYGEEQADTMPRIKGILRLVCNKKNFGGRVLVKAYLRKQLIGVAASAIVLAVTIWILQAMVHDGLNSESFGCNMIYQMNVCMICTIRRKRDMTAFLAVNLVVNLIYFALSIFQLSIFRRNARKAISHYFNEISVYGSVALD